MNLTVFYAWQSDTSQKTNHYFIRDVLKDALKQLSQAGDIAEPARLDYDTKDVPGTPNIINTILSKIDSASIFVADVTFVAKTAGGKLIPNPNVMFEMGYAISRMTDARVITILNEEYGTKDHVPFDIAGSRRPIAYTYPEGEPVPSEDRKKLVSAIADALRMIIEREPLTALNSALRRRAMSIVSDSDHEVQSPPAWRAVWLLPSRIPLGLFELLKNEDPDTICKDADERGLVASVMKEYRIYRDLGDELDNYTVGTIVGKNIGSNSYVAYHMVISGFCLQRKAGVSESDALGTARRQGKWTPGESEDHCRRIYEIASKDKGFQEIFDRFAIQHNSLMLIAEKIKTVFK